MELEKTRKIARETKKKGSIEGKMREKRRKRREGINGKKAD